MNSFEIVTKSADETISLGKTLGKLLVGGVVITLFGDLAAGKTTFTRGVAEGLGIDDNISSPTFTLIHEHDGIIPLYHVDLYRLCGLEDIESIGLEEYLLSEGVTVVEWSERFEHELPHERIDVVLEAIDENERKIVFLSESHTDIIEGIKNAYACN